MEGNTPTPAPTGYSIFVRFGELDALGAGYYPGQDEVALDDLALVGRGYDAADREKAVDAMLDHAEKMGDPAADDLPGRRLKVLASKINAGQRIVFQVAGARGIGEVPVQIERKRKIG